MSVSKTRNSLPNDENGNQINLDGFSGTVNSVEAYFEKERFLDPGQPPLPLGVHGHHAQRDPGHTEKHADRCRELRSTRRSATDFNSGALKGLTLLLQGNNLTNERSITRQSPETVGAVGSSSGLLPWDDENFGRVLLFGASYKF